MTPDEIRTALKALGLTQRQAAPMLGYGDQSRISDLVCGRENPSAAVVLLLRAYMDGYRPRDWPA